MKYSTTFVREIEGGPDAEELVDEKLTIHFTYLSADKSYYSYLTGVGYSCGPEITLDSIKNEYGKEVKLSSKEEEAILDHIEDLMM